MTAQEYIQSELDKLKEPADLPEPKNHDDLVETIFRYLTSKKFRKYSLTNEYAEHIRNSIAENVKANKPVNLTFLGGCYKLWRLDEAPESDWAELFSHLYYSNWVKPVCAVYKPGVWFDFFLDDVIISRINNLPESDIEAYRQSRQNILSFLKTYQPDNLNMTLTGIGSLFKFREDYEKALESSIQKLSSELPGGLPVLSGAQMASTTLNVKATQQQLSDPKWREKVELVHSAYLAVKRATGYSTKSDKIHVFTQPFSNGTCIAVGTTKDSIAKFWAGAGALKRRDGSYRQLVLTPKQLEQAQFEWENVKLDNLYGKNFSKVRVVN